MISSSQYKTMPFLSNSYDIPTKFWKLLTDILCHGYLNFLINLWYKVNFPAFEKLLKLHPSKNELFPNILMTIGWYYLPILYKVFEILIYSRLHFFVFSINSLASGCFRGFSEKKRRNARGFAREFLQSGTGYAPGQSVKRRGKSCSLHSKKFFAWGVRLFCEWRHKWRTFWPTLSDPGRQPLDDGILLKFLLETRLQSESFDTLDDLLRFRVQKLWSKLVKIFE